MLKTTLYRPNWVCLRTSGPLKHGKSEYEVSGPIPHRINEAQSDMRGVKEGWYVMDDEGKLTFGPFSTRDDCLNCLRPIIRPTN